VNKGIHIYNGKVQVDPLVSLGYNRKVQASVSKQEGGTLAHSLEV
jgi:hypothetical protein